MRKPRPTTLQTRLFPALFLIALLAGSGCNPFDTGSGGTKKPPENTNPDNTTPGNTNGNTTAGENSGSTSTGQVPGIDCEGICGTVVDKPPQPEGSGPSNTPPQTYVPSNTPVVVQCFRGPVPGNDNAPLIKVKHSITETSDGKIVTALVVFSRDFTDNTYGVNAIGWSPRKGHTFEMLHKSDHAELSLLDGAGAKVIQAKIDLLSETAKGSATYASLGVDGGDGALLLGNRSDIVGTGSSLDDNFNRYGYVLLTDSPATDSNYTVNPAYPYWNYYAVFRISVKLSAFGAAGFGKALMTFVHASPSKLPSSTINVTEGSCPIPGEKDPFPSNPPVTNVPPDTTSPPDTTRPG